MIVIKSKAGNELSIAAFWDCRFQHRILSHVLRHDVVEGSQQEEWEDYRCCMIWQRLLAMLHSNKQLKNGRDGDTDIRWNDVRNVLYSQSMWAERAENQVSGSGAGAERGRIQWSRARGRGTRAEWWAWVAEVGVSDEQIFRRSRSTHMLWYDKILAENERCQWAMPFYAERVNKHVYCTFYTTVSYTVKMN